MKNLQNTSVRKITGNSGSRRQIHWAQTNMRVMSHDDTHWFVLVTGGREEKGKGASGRREKRGGRGRGKWKWRMEMTQREENGEGGRGTGKNTRVVLDLAIHP